MRREAVCREEILGDKVAQKRPAPAGQRFMPCRAVTNLDWQAGVGRMTWVCASRPWRLSSALRPGWPAARGGVSRPSCQPQHPRWEGT